MKYKVCGSKKHGFAIVDKRGAVEYDLIDIKETAQAICDVLNRGVGPEWDAVSAELERAGKLSLGQKNGANASGGGGHNG